MAEIYFSLKVNNPPENVILIYEKIYLKNSLLLLFGFGYNVIISFSRSECDVLIFHSCK